MESQTGSFWEHLEVLRGAIIRSLAVVLGLAIIVFLFKEFVFEYIVFYPTKTDFPTFRLLAYLSHNAGVADEDFAVQPVKIISTRLAAQFMTHISISFYTALVASVPYICGELWMFIRPALYPQERKYINRALIFTGILFYIGAATAYFMIFPLSVNFLSSYQVTPEIENLISIDSYIDMLVELCITTGIAFELPIASYFLAKAGILKYTFLKRYRKHAFVLVLVIAAIITPSTDAFTMLATALPLYLIFELSVMVVKRVDKHKLLPSQTV
ncbi:MAG: twin-arginine translocase subunit TatC [Bacteroidales bacterium]|nr:twin-arginine translocase subunit TatC [Bacteroidales bacterium]